MIIENKKYSAEDGWSAPARLLFNHFDAWAATFCIAIVALLLHDAVTLQTAVLAMTVTVGYWLAFTLNDYYDAPQDALDAKKARRNFFVLHQPSAWQIRLFVGGLTAVFIFVFAQFGWRGLLLLALCYFIMWSYSAPPLRIKERPGFDIAVHACFVESFPYLLMLLLTQTSWTQLDWVILAITFINSLNAQIEQQAHDFDLPIVQENNFALRRGRQLTQRLLKGITAVLFIFIISKTLINLPS